VGRDFPEGKLFFEYECASISNSLAIQYRDVTAQNAASHPEQRHRLAKLQFDPHTGQQAPIRFDERTAR
jgi:hypothetical protein